MATIFIFEVNIFYLPVIFPVPFTFFSYSVLVQISYWFLLGSPALN